MPGESEFSDTMYAIRSARSERKELVFVRVAEKELLTQMWALMLLLCTDAVTTGGAYNRSLFNALNFLDMIA